MRRVWIDVTDFLNWQGNFTGLQRIQYNIAKSYLASNHTVKFFVYNESGHTFLEVPFDPDVVAKDGIIEVAKNSGSEVSPSLLTRITCYSKRRFPRAWNFLRHSGVKSVIKERAGSLHQVKGPFGENDNVIVLGGIWFGDFMADIAKLKRSQKFKFFHFIHDMIPVITPGYVVEGLPESFSAYKRRVFQISDGIIANSQSTLGDAREFMKQESIKEPPSVVVKIGEDLSSASHAKSDPGLQKRIGGEFILCVGTVEGRKNHSALLYVLKEAKLRGVKIPKIVIAGRVGWLTQDLLYTLKHDIDAKKNIIFVEGPTDSELSWLYRNCRFTIYPSFYEGWGMPVAESLAYGKLCLATNQSSVPEIAGDIIDYYSPYDTGEILETILKYMDDGLLRRKERHIKKLYKPAGWQAMYENIEAFIADQSA